MTEGEPQISIFIFFNYHFSKSIIEEIQIKNNYSVSINDKLSISFIEELYIVLINIFYYIIFKLFYIFGKLSELNFLKLKMLLIFIFIK